MHFPSSNEQVAECFDAEYSNLVQIRKLTSLLHCGAARRFARLFAQMQTIWNSLFSIVYKVAVEFSMLKLLYGRTR